MTQHATWFGPDDFQLFGWLHIPAGGEARGAVVCCPTIGVESMAAHRAVRALAVKLEQAGFLVLRFDYAGTGDSAGDGGAPGQVEDWRRSIREATAFVRDCGVSQVGLVGFRLGGTLAAGEAQADGDIDALVLWDACVSGRSFLRGEKVLREVSVEAPAMSTLAGDPPGIEILGTVFPDSVAEELAEVDLLSHASGPVGRRTLVLSREDRPLPAVVKAAFDQPTTQWGLARGQAELVDVTADLAVVPVTTISLIAWWLDTTLGTAMHPVTATLREQVTIELGHNDGAIVERAVRIGPNSLSGVRTEPVGGSIGPTVVFLNAGLLNRSGPARLWVTLARRLAASGMASVRVDLSGLGDSGTRPGQARDITYLAEGTEDVADIVGALRGAPDATVDDVVLVGLCSGAYHALEAGIEVSPRGVCAINPLLSLDEPAPLAGSSGPVRLAAEPLRPWIKRLSRHAKLASFAEYKLPSWGWWLLDLLRIQRHPAHGLRLLADRGVPTMLLCGEAEARPFQRRARWAVGRLVRRKELEFVVLPASDHTLYGANARARAISIVTSHLLTSYSPDSAEPTEQVSAVPAAPTDGAKVLAPALPVPRAREPQPAGRSRLGTVVLVASSGLALQAIGYALGRAGSSGPVQPLFFIGLMTIFVPCAWRLLGSGAERRERIRVSVVLGCTLVLSCYLLSPTLFSGYDELLHQTTLWQLADGRSLFATNTLLPVSSDYPGLELLTLAIHWLSGLPLIACELGVVMLSRLVLVLVIFLVGERLIGSARAGSVAVVGYAVSPQFYAFNSAYSYQTLALTLGAGAVYLMLRALDSSGRQRRTQVRLAVVCLLGVVVTHHLVSWLTIGALVAWAAVLGIAGRREHARVVAAGAAAGLLLGGLWTAITVSRLFGYLSPIIGGAAGGVFDLMTGGNQRALFSTPAGPVAPLWQRFVQLAATALLLGLIVIAGRAFVRNRGPDGGPVMRGGRLRYVPLAVAAAYVVVLGSRLSSASQEVGGRMSTFVFFGIAFVLAAWFVTGPRRASRVLAVSGASLAFLGGVLFGSGPSWSLVPGSYIPAADGRSIDSSAIAAAQWAADNVRPGTPIAADRVNGALMAAIGHMKAVSEGTSKVNVGPLYFDRVWGNYDTSLVRRARIRYLVVDARLAQGPPAFGTYFEPGETQGRELLTAAQLSKFNAVPGIASVYVNGPIRIYDLSNILGVAPLIKPDSGAAGASTASSALDALTGTDWLVLFCSCIVLLAWVRRVRSRRLTADGLVTFLLVSGVLGIVGAFVLVPSGLPIRPVALSALAIMFVAGVLPERTRSHLAAAGRRSIDFARRVVRIPAPQFVQQHRARSLLAAALSAVLIVGAIAVSVVSDEGEWHSPIALSVVDASHGHRLAAVQLVGSEAHVRLELRASDGAVLWLADVPSHVKDFSVAMPGQALAVAAMLSLVVDGVTVRSVSP